MDVPFLSLRLACLGQIYVLGEVSFSVTFGLLNAVAPCYSRTRPSRHQPGDFWVSARPHPFRFFSPTSVQGSRVCVPAGEQPVTMSARTLGPEVQPRQLAVRLSACEHTLWGVQGTERVNTGKHPQLCFAGPFWVLTIVSLCCCHYYDLFSIAFQSGASRHETPECQSKCISVLSHVGEIRPHYRRECLWATYLSSHRLIGFHTRCALLPVSSFLRYHL